VVDDHHQPEKLDCPRYDENPRHGAAASNRVGHIDDHGPARTSPSTDRHSTQTRSAAAPATTATAVTIRTLRLLRHIE
jgi:hypothetical protein